MAQTHFTSATLEFLSELKKNNNRDWFDKHKDRYKAAYAEVKAFAKTLQDRMSHHDQIEQLKLHRIYRDIRFSKDKTPYKSHFSGSMSRATKWRRGGYYFQIQPGESFAGGGFWAPNSTDLKRIREEIAADDHILRNIIHSDTFQQTFGALQGEQVKTAPRGFAKDHPAIDLLRYKQFLISHSFSDQQVLAPDFVDQLTDVFVKMRPFFDYMSEVLTTDANGVPIA